MGGWRQLEAALEQKLSGCLRVLGLSGCEIHREYEDMSRPAVLWSLPAGLEELNLSGNRGDEWGLCWGGFATTPGLSWRFEFMTKLLRLDLARCNFCVSTGSVCSTLPISLKFLSLAGNFQSGFGAPLVERIKLLTSLEHFDLSGNRGELHSGDPEENPYEALGERMRVGELKLEKLGLRGSLSQSPWYTCLVDAFPPTLMHLDLRGNSSAMGENPALPTFPGLTVLVGDYVGKVVEEAEGTAGGQAEVEV